MLVSVSPLAAKDISGIACAEPDGFPRHCLVVDDESQAAQFVVLTDGAIRAGTRVPLIDDASAGHALSLDGEGVAYADGSFYVIGSHGHPRDRKHKLDPVENADEIAGEYSTA
jgi:hypothetical protein